MTISLAIRPSTRVSAVLFGTALALACAPKKAPTLAALCAGSATTAHITATIDTTRPPAGPELAAARGTRFELDFAFTAAAAPPSEAGCTGTTGTATFTGTLPDRIRGATSASGRATWRIEGDTVLLDLNPGTRDNNIFLVLPLQSGRGHWGLSTFAGEVAGGGAESHR
jgi:hypothetical protein